MNSNENRLKMYMKLRKRELAQILVNCNDIINGRFADNSLEKVSQREYARRIGLSNTAVSKAIRQGKIKKGWDRISGKIIVQYANEEYGDKHLTTEQ